jgi:hypothetical protein
LSARAALAACRASSSGWSWTDVVEVHVQEGVDHLREQLGAGHDLLIGGGDWSDHGGAARLKLVDEPLHPGRVDALVALQPAADTDDTQRQARTAGKHVGDELHPVPGAGRGAGVLDLEALGGVVPAVGDEHECAVDAGPSRAQEVGSDGEGVPDRRASARREHRNETFDVGEVLPPDLGERYRHPNRLRERYEAEGGARTFGVLKNPVDRGAGDLDLLFLGGVGGARVGQRREHALGEVEDEHLTLAPRWYGRRGTGFHLRHRVTKSSLTTGSYGGLSASERTDGPGTWLLTSNK